MPPSETAAPDLAGIAASTGEDLLVQVTALALEAGAAILKIYTGPEIAAAEKADGSPVTAADEAAEAVILDGLARIAPNVPVVAEEAVSRSGAPDTASAGRFWLVDPLDGTKEFLNRNGEFTVNIALVQDGRPVLGVVHAPALAETYSGAVGLGAWHADNRERRVITARHPGPEGLVVVASRSHGDPAALDRFLEGRRVAGRREVGSSLKFCLVAAGEADLYPRFGRTMEWDTAAGHAVLAAAGGRVTDLDGAPLRYGKPGFDTPHFVARGRE
ncbi:MAG: 3'(2'),5'-bisphosphate nucleotidase CysQ [Azospirillaceae bacterium]